MKRIRTAAMMLAVLTGCAGFAGCVGGGGMPMYMDEAALEERASLYGMPSETEPYETTGITEPLTTEPSATKLLTTEPPTTEPPVTEPVIPPAETIDGDVVVQNGILLVNSGTNHVRAIELYSGSFKNGERCAGVLNRFRAKLPEEVFVYCMMIPTSAAYYVPEDMAEQYGSQKENYDNLAEHLDGVIGVPLYEPLLYHRNEPLYSRTDYHWQPLGAYYAAAELAKAADVPFAPIESYSGVEREGYVGAFAAVNGISELYDAPEEFTYYKPANLDKLNCYYYDTDFTNGRSGAMFHEDNATSSAYTIFVGTDTCIFQTDTDADNDRILVIFKDSYGNALIPFLTESFSTIYLCDFRYFDTDAVEFVEKVGATDVAFAMSSIVYTTSVKVDTLEKTLGI